MITYHQAKFSCKRISSSDNTLKSHSLNIISLIVTLTLKTVNQSFWKTIWLIMMHHHTKFGSKKDQQFRKYHLDKHSLTFWNFTVTLTLNTTVQFLPKILWPMTMYYLTKFGSKRMSTSKDTVEIVIFWSYELMQWPWPWK